MLYWCVSQITPDLVDNDYRQKGSKFRSAWVFRHLVQGEEHNST